MNQLEIQEHVSDGSLFITRIPVPGGWVYNSFDKGHSMLGSCFVPDTKKDIDDALTKELESMKLHRKELTIDNYDLAEERDELKSQLAQQTSDCKLAWDNYSRLKGAITVGIQMGGLNDRDLKAMLLDD